MVIAVANHCSTLVYIARLDTSRNKYSILLLLCAFFKLNIGNMNMADDVKHDEARCDSPRPQKVSIWALFALKILPKYENVEKMSQQQQQL